MAEYIDENSFSLFDINEPEKEAGTKLDVVKLGYISAEAMTWQELFKGYNELYAITFSSGINFVYALLDMFDKAEVIFGSEEVMSFSMQEIMAYQSKTLERIRETSGKARQKLLDRIEDGSVHLYVARKRLSHEKIYLLKADRWQKARCYGFCQYVI